MVNVNQRDAGGRGGEGAATGGMRTCIKTGIIRKGGKVPLSTLGLIFSLKNHCKKAGSIFQCLMTNAEKASPPPMS